MNQPGSAHSSALNIDELHFLDAPRAFAGFQPLTANYVYCPNQFFDICLKSNSRGMVRIVAYILRQTLGWLDDQGEPISQSVKISYCDLIEKAGVSRGAIGPAIQRAVAAGFIQCSVPGKSKSPNQSGQTAEYSLRWDQRNLYAKSIENFGGFFTGEGNRTPIPNAFFDTVVPTESLAVSKVVGTVIRHTVGYQNQFGGRRSHAPLSYTHIQNYTNLGDRKTLALAIRNSIEAGYILRTEAGNFDPDESKQITASYAVRWLEQANPHTIGSKTPPAAKRFNKPTRIGSKTPPENRFKNPTSIKTTSQNKIDKQQPDVADFQKIVTQLATEGFARETAEALVRKRGLDVVERQLRWLEARKPRDNRLGLLRKAIEEDWSEPEASKLKQKVHQARIRDANNESANQIADSRYKERQKIRNERKNRLLKEWNSASLEVRARWIESAAKAQSASMLRDIIRRQQPDSEKPHVQVLDALALQLELPAVSSHVNSLRRIVEQEKGQPRHK